MNRLANTEPPESSAQTNDRLYFLADLDPATRRDPASDVKVGAVWGGA